MYTNKNLYLVPLDLTPHKSKIPDLYTVTLPELAFDGIFPTDDSKIKFMYFKQWRCFMYLENMLFRCCDIILPLYLDHYNIYDVSIMFNTKDICHISALVSNDGLQDPIMPKKIYFNSKSPMVMKEKDISILKELPVGCNNYLKYHQHIGLSLKYDFFIKL